MSAMGVVHKFAARGMHWIVAIWMSFLSLFAILDQYNAHTTKIDGWVALLVLQLCLVSGNFLYWTIRSARHEGKADFYSRVKKSGGVAAASLDVDLIPLKGLSAVSQEVEIQRAWVSEFIRKGMYTLFYATMSLFSLWCVMQVAFISDYIKDASAFKAAMDDGFDTGVPASFTMHKKLLLLYSIQLSWITCTLMSLMMLGTRVMSAKALAPITPA